MIKTSKNLMLIALLSLSGLAVWAACSTTPILCNYTASVTVPPGGACYTVRGFCFASAIAHDANGNLVEQDTVECPKCPYS